MWRGFALLIYKLQLLEQINHQSLKQIRRM